MRGAEQPLRTACGLGDAVRSEGAYLNAELLRDGLAMEGGGDAAGLAPFFQRKPSIDPLWSEFQAMPPKEAVVTVGSRCLSHVSNSLVSCH